MFEPHDSESKEMRDGLFEVGPRDDLEPHLETAASADEKPFIPEQFTPISANEAGRRFGLAWSAGIAFFGAIAFMWFIGWLADLVLGSSPWGVVGGIIIGAVIGFIQFFWLTSRIYGDRSDKNAIRPLLSGHDDESSDND